MTNVQLRSALSSAFRRLALHYPASGFAKQAGPLLDEWERELNGIWLDAIDPAVSAWIEDALAEARFVIEDEPYRAGR